MNDKVKNSSNHIQNRVTEAPIIALTTELEKAFQNFKNSHKIKPTKTVRIANARITLAMSSSPYSPALNR